MDFFSYETSKNLFHTLFSVLLAAQISHYNENWYFSSDVCTSIIFVKQILFTPKYDYEDIFHYFSYISSPTTFWGMFWKGKFIQIIINLWFISIFFQFQGQDIVWRLCLCNQDIQHNKNHFTCDWISKPIDKVKIYDIWTLSKHKPWSSKYTIKQFYSI